MKVYKQPHTTNIKIALNSKDASHATVENVLYWWNICSEEERAFDWYAEAKAFCHYLENSYAFSFETCAKVISVLSPLNKWEQNKKQAEAILDLVSQNAWLKEHVNAFVSEGFTPKEAIQTIVTPVHMFNHMTQTAILVALGYTHILAQKTQNFYDNIIGRSDAVTVDSIAGSIAIGLGDVSGSYKFTPNAFKAIEDIYLSAANLAGVTPAQLQAVTWCKARQAKQHNSGNTLLSAYTALSQTLETVTVNDILTQLGKERKTTNEHFKRF